MNHILLIIFQLQILTELPNIMLCDDLKNFFCLHFHVSLPD